MQQALFVPRCCADRLERPFQESSVLHTVLVVLGNRGGRAALGDFTNWRKNVWRSHIWGGRRGDGASGASSPASAASVAHMPNAMKRLLAPCANHDAAANTTYNVTLDLQRYLEFQKETRHPLALCAETCVPEDSLPVRHIIPRCGKWIAGETWKSRNVPTA